MQTEPHLSSTSGPAGGAPLRYLVAVIGAFALDLLLAMILREAAGLPVWLAAGTSFIIVGVSAYFVHEHWTFKRPESHASAGRFARNMAALAAAFLARVGVIAGMEAVHDPEALLAAIYIVVGAGVSLTVNFTLNRFWVFRAPGHHAS